MNRQKNFEASGVVSKISSRVAKSGSHAHSFNIHGKKYSFFIDDPQHPLIEGDVVRFSFQTRTLRGRHKTKYKVADLETLVIDGPADAIAASENGLPMAGAGTIYVASNADMPGLLKIGYTTRDPKTRVMELGAVTGVPSHFKLLWTMPVERFAKEIEGLVHSKLGPKRAGKEFFRVSLEDAKDTCRASYLAIDPDGARRLNKGLAGRAEKIAEARETRDARLLDWQAEQDEKKRQQEWTQSSEGRWRLQQSTSWIIEDFDPSLDRGQAPFYLSIFGRRNPDFLDMQISYYTDTVIRDDRPVQSSEWHISAFGWRYGEPCKEEARRAATWESAYRSAMEIIASHPATNRRVAVSVSNANLRHAERNAGSTTPVKPEFIEECLQRLELVPKSENDVRAPDDWRSNVRA